MFLNPLKAELNPICHLLALLGAHHILHVGRIRVNCSTCFERHTAHHQELTNCNCSLWFYMRLWLPVAVMAEPWQLPAITVYELLMMSDVSLETCWAIKKHWNNKFYYTVASCCLFLYDLQNLKLRSEFTFLQDGAFGTPDVVASLRRSCKE